MLVIVLLSKTADKTNKKKPTLIASNSINILYLFCSPTALSINNLSAKGKNNPNLIFYAHPDSVQEGFEYLFSTHSNLRSLGTKNLSQIKWDQVKGTLGCFL